MVSERFPRVTELRANALGWRIASVYGALFFGIGVSLPFLPVWLKARGLGVEQIALVLAAQSVLRVVASPLMSHVADRLGRLRPVMTGCAALALAGLLWLAGARGFAAILLGVIAAYAAFAPLMPLTEAYAVSAVKHMAGLDYGRMRLWGSLAFIAGNLVAGASLDVMEAGNLIWLIVAAQAALVGALMLLPPRGAHEEARARAPGQGVVRHSFLSAAFIIFVLAVGLAQGSHALVYGFSALHWKALGHSGAVTGMLWATGVLAEVVLFWFSGAVMARLGAVRLLMLGAGAAVIRWLGLSLDPPLALLFAFQALHGLSFGASHLGAIEYIKSRVAPERMATAQAIYGAVAGGVFMTGSMWASGKLFRAYGAHAWWFMAVMAGLAFMLALALRRISPRAPERAD